MDFTRMFEEAKGRWLRPNEIHEVLHNHHRFQIRIEPVSLPPSGTLVLFDRKVLRNFRKDGHIWQKKNDNKTVKEAHEHLKVCGEEKIHVYYAHGQSDYSFQRRVYWLLDKALEHIVLVHYLQLKEGNKNVARVWNGSSAEDGISTGNTNSPGDSEAQSTTRLESNQLEFSSNFDEFTLDDLHSSGKDKFFTPNVAEPWIPLQQISSTAKPKHLGINSPAVEFPNQANYLQWPTASSDFGYNTTEPYVDGSSLMQTDGTSNQISELYNSHTQNPKIQGNAMDLANMLHSGVQSDHSFKQNGQGSHVEVSYLNMNENIELLQQGELQSSAGGVELNSNLFFPHQQSYSISPEDASWLDSLPPLSAELDVSISCLPEKSSSDWAIMHQSPECSTAGDNSSLTNENQYSKTTPVFPPKELFTITDIVPSSADSSEETKVIIIGHYIGDPNEFLKGQWFCLFGDTEVMAEVVQAGVLRCKAPSSPPGKAVFSVTLGNKNICSDLREFEYKASNEKPRLPGSSKEIGVDHDELLQIRFAKLLLNTRGVPDVKANKANAFRRAKIKALLATYDQEWEQLEEKAEGSMCDLVEVKERLLLILLKQKLKDWIFWKLYEEKGQADFDEHGQGVLHLASSLGYVWVIAPIITAGINIDFRDKHGWTALHWAAMFGREKMVVALIAAGAKPGLVTDPTPKCPTGQTPADLAEGAGYDGISAYLSEKDLTAHLSSLTLTETERDKKIAAEEGLRVIDYLNKNTNLWQSLRTNEDETSLKESLVAVRNATVAAARIHAAFREYSFKQRMRALEEVDDFGLPQEQMRMFFAAKRIQTAYRRHREHQLQESAALRIQNKFRGWKGRRDYLNMRQKVIKIQAYFRMHRARKQYHKLVWSVGVLEKAILRWRQKRKGLRGFHIEMETMSEEESVDEFLKAGRRQVEESLDKSVDRVQAMVRSGHARQQYRRMRQEYETAKDELEYQDNVSNRIALTRMDSFR